MSMTLRRFAAQLLCVRERPGKDVNTISHSNFEDAESWIWPEHDDTVTLPAPAGALDDDLYDKWHTRWNNPKAVAPAVQAV